MAAYSLNEFGNSYVHDERMVYYVRGELENLLEIKGGEKLTLYEEAMFNIATRTHKKEPSK